MNPLTNLALSVGETLVHESGRLLFGVALGRAKELLGTPQQLGTRQLALNRALQKKAVDGALLAGPRTGKEYAKFTLKKGLPTDQRPKTLALENEPHSVDDFDGVIKEGYGKGEKRLIYSDTGVIKVGGSRQLGKINIHEHEAEKAGFHYDFVRHLHIVPAMPEGGDPVEFYRTIIHDPRGLPWSEGVVVKYRDSADEWFKVKANDTLDVRVIRCLEGAGKSAGSLGAMVVEGPTGVESEIGSFQLTNEQRRWIWEHRDLLTGQIAEVRALTVNESGAIRAGVFVRFHPSRSEAGLLMYSESLSGGDPGNPEARSTGSRVLLAGEGRCREARQSLY